MTIIEFDDIRVGDTIQTSYKDYGRTILVIGKADSYLSNPTSDFCKWVTKESGVILHKGDTSISGFTITLLDRERLEVPTARVIQVIDTVDSYYENITYAVRQSDGSYTDSYGDNHKADYFTDWEDVRE